MLYHWATSASCGVVSPPRRVSLQYRRAMGQVIHALWGCRDDATAKSKRCSRKPDNQSPVGSDWKRGSKSPGAWISSSCTPPVTYLSNHCCTGKQSDATEIWSRFWVRSLRQPRKRWEASWSSAISPSSLSSQKTASFRRSAKSQPTSHGWFCGVGRHPSRVLTDGDFRRWIAGCGEIIKPAVTEAMNSSVSQHLREQANDLSNLLNSRIITLPLLDNHGRIVGIARRATVASNWLTPHRWWCSMLPDSWDR